MMLFMNKELYATGTIFTAANLKFIAFPYVSVGCGSGTIS